MKRSFLFPAPALLWAAAAAFGQTAPAGPAFEVATIKRSPPFDMNLFFSGKAHMGVRIDKAYADLGDLSLLYLVAYAYRVKPYQVSGPDSIDGTHFDVLAKLPEGASKDSVPEMVQALLAARFNLKLHAETRDLKVYALVVGAGGSKLRLKPADYQPDYTVKDSGPSGPPRGDLVPGTMEDYAKILSEAVDRPVVDRTGLKGEYMLPVYVALQAANDHNAEVHHMPPRPGIRGQGGPIDDSVPFAADSTVSQALVDGLKLEPRKVPMTMLVIDHVDENPTAN
jgi:uncharacterized protein (TIGR03435 family)